MRRVRPYIPLEVRVEVAERDAFYLMSEGVVSPATMVDYRFLKDGKSLRWRLSNLIEILEHAHGEKLQLDHDPALILRQYKVDRRKPEAAWYTPNANDPAHLIYRPEREHDQKTFGRRADAEKTVTTKGSDIWLKSKFRRLESPSKKPRAKIAQRKKPWPKGRKLPARPFPR